MTLAASVAIERYDGDDVTTNFSFPHMFWNNSEIEVTHKTTAGVVTNPVIDVDYTVNGVGTTSGSIDFPKVGSSYSTLASGSPDERLTIRRVLTKQQTPDLNGAHQFSTLNTGNDKQTAMIQELLEMINRAALQTVSNSDDVPTLEQVLSGVASLDISSLTALGTLTGTDIFHVNDGVDKKMAASVLATYIATLHYLKSEHLDSSAGAGDAGKPIKLGADGKVDATMIDSADVDHDATTNYVAAEHFIQSAITALGTVVTGTVNGLDTTAIHDNVSAEISAISEKASPVNADLIIIEDSADSNNKKKVQVGNLPGAAGSPTAPTFAVKTSDESVVSSTVLQDDDELFLAVEANKTYFFELLLIYNANTTPDIKIGWTYPAGATMAWRALDTYWDLKLTESGVAVGIGQPTIRIWSGIRGTLWTAGTAGNLQLQWAQNTSSALVCDVLTGSWLMLHKMD